MRLDNYLRIEHTAEYLFHFLDIHICAENAVVNPIGEKYHPTPVNTRIPNFCDCYISEDELFDAFLRSARQAVSTTDSWEQEWNSLLDELGPEQVAQLDRDSVLEELTLAAATDHAVRHSAAYRQAYHPHYRIVEKNIFEQELRPRIDAHLPVR